jgi:hypothetical protein
MKNIINYIFKMHLKIFKFPCRMHSKYALYKKSKVPVNLLWRCSMLYVCDLGIDEIARWLEISEEEVKNNLKNFTEGVIYE